MPKGGLSRWFDENWVDLSRPKDGGGFEPCGRTDASEGKYPKCVPASRAAKMTPEEIKSAIRRKRRAESTETREDKKPINVPTIKKAKRPGISSIPEPTVSKRNVPENMELYNRIKAEAKRKFDVYPSAYANGWLVQEYKRRGGTYKTISKHQPGKHKQATHAGGRKGSANNTSTSQSSGPLTDEEFTTLAKSIQGNFRSKLSKDELNGIEHYFGDNYMGINRILRDGPREGHRYDDYMVEYANQMESSFDKAAVELPRDTSVYRGMQIFPDESFKLEVGSVVIDKGYSSTSAENLGAMKFAGVLKPKPRGSDVRQVIMKINVPKGTKVLTSTGEIGTYGGESEILLNKGAKFKVVSVEKIKGVKASPQSERINPHELITVELVP